MKVSNKAGVAFQSEAFHWLVEDVPAFKKEPYMTCEHDYIARINFALSQIVVPGRPIFNAMKSWESLNKALVEEAEFVKVVTGSNFLKKTVDELTLGITDPFSKAKAIYEYVTKNIEWDGVNDKYPDNLRTVLDNKKGSAADVNFILAAMFDKADIPTEMVLLSTRDHGFIREEYPMERQMNYVICSAKIGDKKMLIDATDRHLPMGMLPERCLNGKGLLISSLNHGWITIDTKIKARTIIEGQFTLDEDASLKGKLSFLYDGYDAHEMRAQYFKNGEENFLKAFLTNRLWNVGKTECQHFNDIGTSPKQIHEVIINEHASSAGSVIYMNPFVSNQMKENVFKSQERLYPVDFGSPQEVTYMAKITIPEGFTIEEIPNARVIALQGNAARFAYNITVSGNVITIVSVFQINKSLFVQTEYADLREFYNQVVAKQAEQIVLKKKL